MLFCALAGTAATTVDATSAVPSRRCLSFIRVLPSCSADFPAGSGPALVFGRIAFSFARLIRERPHPEFLLADLPQPREAVRLDDQAEDNQRSDDHKLQLLHGGWMQRQANCGREYT